MTVSLSPSTKRKLDQEVEQQAPKERKKLRIEIPTLPGLGDSPSPDRVDSLFSSVSYDSLFDEPQNLAECASDAVEELVTVTPPLALNYGPPIGGLYFEPSLRIPQETADSVVEFCMKTYFTTPGANQVMLFGRAPAARPEPSDDCPTPTLKDFNKPIGLPDVLCSLLDTLRAALHPVLPSSTHALLFPSKPTMARQAIINLYEPGDGITPHVDLLGRYADGIIGVSFGSGCVMRFDKVSTPTTPSSGPEDDAEDPPEPEPERTRWDLHLPKRSVIVLSGEARYDWTHGDGRRRSGFRHALARALSSATILFTLLHCTRWGEISWFTTITTWPDLRPSCISLLPFVSVYISPLQEHIPEKPIPFTTKIMSSSAVDISSISGNASDSTKEVLSSVHRIFANRTGNDNAGPIFGEAIQKRLQVTEVSVNPKAEEPQRLEGKVVLETIVEEDMLNGGGIIHGGCSAFLIDVCSTLALIALNLETTQGAVVSVSQALNVVYHSPAALGDKIRIVNQTITVGARAHSVRTEIWNVTHHRLVSSGTHIKMQPSAPKANL
ncbi:hypothetical protein EST38_g10458 [Candolleomyces aberdarensis]|uniref:Fe2OG dioxygenase domain-containing protein n=1 Tax=Candolleomyces aberdarensis TaxID=2316362 RepID=A0A4Q2D7C1_9AGAR|nr:hypothetical protein EST38_g10458 [Candolleomyces aberdarensis]